MKEYELYIFDLDGTLYRGEEAIPEAVEAVDRLVNRGAKVRYLTNNASQTLETFAKKLSRLGFPAEPSDVTSSASGTAKYCLEAGIGTVQALGEPGMIELFRSQGLEVQGPEEDWSQPADAVVVGIFRTFTYSALANAMTSIRAGSRFVATNADATFPIEGGKVTPGAGSIVAAVQTASETNPYIVGKPNAFLTQLVMNEAGVSSKSTLVVGDRLDTDIDSGRAAGCDTLLVLTGVSHSAPEGQVWANDLSGL